MGQQHERSGRWGKFGGRYTAEALWDPLEEIADAFDEAIVDEAFVSRFHHLLDHRVGRPTPLDLLSRLSEELGGAKLWLKREDLCQGGSFCANLATFYALLAARMGRTALVGETSSGDFGVALGSAGASLGLDVHVFMSREDIHNEPRRVAQMRHVGVKLHAVDATARGRRLSGAEAMRYWSADLRHHFYATSLLTSPDPYPRLIGHVLDLIGAEARVQMRHMGLHADYIIAPLGTGGFASGLFASFIEDEQIQLVGVQAGGEPQAGRHAASLLSGGVGVFQGTYSNVLQDANGQLLKPYSIAGGLCSAGVGPQHAWWAAQGSVIYTTINDREAIEASRKVARLEGLDLSLESAHALSYAFKLMPKLSPEQNILVGVSGDGGRDLDRVLPEGEERRS